MSYLRQTLRQSDVPPFPFLRVKRGCPRSTITGRVTDTTRTSGVEERRKIEEERHWNEIAIRLTLNVNTRREREAGEGGGAAVPREKCIRPGIQKINWNFWLAEM